MNAPGLWSKFEASNPTCEIPLGESFTNIGSPTFDATNGKWNNGLKCEAGKAVKKTGFNPAGYSNWGKFSLVLNIKTSYSVTAGVPSDGLAHSLFTVSNGTFARDFTLWDSLYGLGWEGTGGPNVYSYSAAAVAWTANEWHQIVLEVDNTATKKIRFLIDGTEVFSSTSAMATNTSTNILFFGIFYDSSSYSLKGAMDNPMMFGYIPTASDYAHLATNESYASTPAAGRRKQPQIFFM